MTKRSTAIPLGSVEHGFLDYLFGNRYIGASPGSGTFAPAGRTRYVTETVANPVAVWRQFCAEARIEHKGDMKQPPLEQTEIFP